MTSIKYNCGCGFVTYLLEEAVKHSNDYNHILTVLGTIKPEVKE